MSDKSFFTVVVTTNNGSTRLFEELDSFAFIECGCEGVEEYSIDEKIVDDILGERAYSGGILPSDVLNDVESYQKNGSSRKYFFLDDSYLKFVAHVKSSCPSCSVAATEEKYEDWNTLWRSSFKPININDKIRVVPEWMRDEYTEGKNIYIYPGMGFGTGGHETTNLCLQEIVRFSEGSNRWSCFDFGCGSGILGIAALKLGACAVTFCDVDKDALDNCHHNLNLNFDISKLLGSVLVSRQNLKQNKQYELVVANILVDILQSEYTLIASSVIVGGSLVLSGILSTQLDETRDFYLKDGLFQMVTHSTKGDWASLVLSKKR